MTMDFRIYKSSYMFYYSFNITYYKIRAYYLLLCDIIQNQTKILSEEEIKESKIRILKDKNYSVDDDTNPNKIYELKKAHKYFIKYFQMIYVQIKSNYRILYYIYKEMEIKQKIGDKNGKIFSGVFTEKNFEIEVKPSIVINKNSMNMIIGFCISLFEINFNDYFKFKLPISYIDIIFAIIPSVSISACIQTGFEINWKKQEYFFSIDVSGKAEASVSLDLGIYCPKNISMVSISIHLGIHGILGSGEVGVKLSLFLTDDKFKLDLYSKIKAVELSVYFLFRLNINFKVKFLKIFKLKDITIEVIIFSYKFFTMIEYEYHMERFYKYNNELISKRNFSTYSIVKLDFYYWSKTVKEKSE